MTDYPNLVVKSTPIVDALDSVSNVLITSDSITDTLDSVESQLLPIAGVSITYLQKVFDPGGNQWVYWDSSGSANVSGTSFVSPWSTPFASCSGYRIVSIS